MVWILGIMNPKKEFGNILVRIWVPGLVRSEEAVSGFPGQSEWNLGLVCSLSMESGPRPLF